MFGGDVGAMAEKYRLDYMATSASNLRKSVISCQFTSGTLIAAESTPAILALRGQGTVRILRLFQLRSLVYRAGRHARRTSGLHQCKVSSSIAHFVIVRVWLEGYHSFGGAGPEAAFICYERKLSFWRELASICTGYIIQPRRVLGMGAALLSFPSAVLGSVWFVFEIF